MQQKLADLEVRERALKEEKHTLEPLQQELASLRESLHNQEVSMYILCKNVMRHAC